MFWPKEIWGLYADSLSDFKEPRNAKQAVQCLNHMVTDALRYKHMCTVHQVPHKLLLLLHHFAL